MTEAQGKNLKSLVANLRGGNYLQYRGGLRSSDGKLFCFSGVGNDLFLAQTGHGSWNQESHEFGGNYFFELHGEIVSGSMPKEVGDDYYGIEWEMQDAYIQMNDGGSSFEEIANQIESDYQEVFGPPMNFDDIIE